MCFPCLYIQNVEVQCYYGNIVLLMFKNGMHDDIAENINKVYNECKECDIFMILSGCIIPDPVCWRILMHILKR